MHAEAGKEARVNMADAESPYRSVRTDSRQRVIYGISIAIVGGKRRDHDPDFWTFDFLFKSPATCELHGLHWDPRLPARSNQSYQSANLWKESCVA